jgi:hypothetical protein
MGDVTLHRTSFEKRMRLVFDEPPTWNFQWHNRQSGDDDLRIHSWETLADWYLYTLSTLILNTANWFNTRYDIGLYTYKNFYANYYMFIFFCDYAICPSANRN